MNTYTSENKTTFIYNSDFSSNAKIIYNNIELEYEYANLFNIEGVLEDLRKIADPDICEINNKSKLIKNKKHHKKLTNKK